MNRSTKSDLSDVNEFGGGDECDVRRMYEFAPYPDLGADPKDLSQA